MKKLALVIVCITWALSGNAQLNTADIGKKPDIPSWDTYEFMKYGTVGASLYTGTVNYSVPLYTYKDNEFEIPLSVDYATNGFRVNHKSGFLGQSWTLGGVGKITREIKGMPDERRKTVFGTNSISSMTIKGYKEISNETLVKDILCGGDNRVYTCLISLDNQAYDAEPDIYHFNFCGFSGSFRRTTPDIQGNPRFVFFNESTNSRAINVKILDENSDIILLDGNGYEYLFQADEYVKEPYDETVVGATREPKIIAWHLSKITSPSGREVEFLYYTNDAIENELSYYPSLSYFHSFVGSAMLVNGGYSSESIDVIEHKSFTSKLTAIIFPDDTHLGLNYEQAEREFYHSTPNGTLNPVLRIPDRLSSISVTRANKVLKSIKFSFDAQHSPYPGNGNTITFLSGINISGQGQYGFDYYPMSGYPALASIKSDHWGYYNGESGGFSTQNFFSNLNFDSNYNESYSNLFHKSPNFNAALSGSLKQITYPTGGYSRITYEPHTYCKKVIRNSSTMFCPEIHLADSTIETGGIRLKQIVTYLSDSVPCDTTIYDYGTGGNLLNVPRYGIYYQTQVQTQTGIATKTVRSYNLTNDMFNYNRTHIEYGLVREFKSGKGYKDYYFSTYSDSPDPDRVDVNGYEDKDARMTIFNIFEVNGGNLTRVYSTNPNNLVTNILTPVASMQQKRGLLTKENSYNNNGTLLKTKENIYTFPSVCVDTIFTITGELAREVYYPRFNIELTRSEETNYFGNHQVVKRTDFVYNKYGMPTEVSSSSSDGVNIVESNKYSGDTLATSGVLMSMRENNIVNAVIQSEAKKAETTLNKTRYTYYQPNEDNSALIRPASTEVWTQSDGWLTTNSYLFNNNGLLSQVTDADGIKTSYLWSYKGKHPVVIAQNTEWQTLAQVLSAAGVGTPEQLSESEEVDDTTFDRLSTIGTYLPNSSVSIYRYKPNAGVSEVVMPNNLRIYYDYDGYGRMTSISDSKNKKLEQREYNLVTITPLTASLSCPASCHVNDSINISVNSQGGCGAYSYDWEIKNSQGYSVYSTMTSLSQLELHPYVVGVHAEDDYSVECVVTDLLSDETVVLSSPLHVNPAIIEFSDINTTIDLASGRGSSTASIYTDSPVTVQFQIERRCAGSCTLKIGNTQYAVSNNVGTYSYSLESGSTDIEITVASSFAETNVSLQIISAGDHEIGNANCINLDF